VRQIHATSVAGREQKSAGRSIDDGQAFSPVRMNRPSVDEDPTLRDGSSVQRGSGGRRQRLVNTRFATTDRTHSPASAPVVTSSNRRWLST
jgi:hypothetical protein